MEEKNEDKTVENMKKCPHFNNCSQNFCPLDPELFKRAGQKQDKCRWMRETKATKIAGREFVSGGRVMPDALLNFVPEGNLKRLNKLSQERWNKLHRKEI